LVIGEKSEAMNLVKDFIEKSSNIETTKWFQNKY
jgi:hypothetical protein